MKNWGCTDHSTGKLRRHAANQQWKPQVSTGVKPTRYNRHKKPSGFIGHQVVNCFQTGGCDEMVIIVGNWPGNPGSNHGWYYLHITLC